MEDFNAAIKGLFQRYPAVWRAYDLCLNSINYIAIHFATHRSTNASAADKPGLIALHRQIFADLEADGFSPTEVGPVTAQLFAGVLALMDAINIRRLRGDGAHLAVGDSPCTRKQIEGEWRFTTAMFCASGGQNT